MTIQKVDSNATGLRYAEEASLRTLPGGAVFYPLEPNSYKDFGGQIKTVARNPINPSRQRKKGVTTDLDAAGGFQQDLTFDNTTRLLQGFFFADIREKFTTAPMNGAATAITGVTGATGVLAAAAGLAGVLSGALVQLTGFAQSANHGVFPTTAASTGTTLTLGAGAALADEAGGPGAARVVGQQFAAGTMNVALNGSLVRLSRASGTFDLTTLGLIPGEWAFLGDDTVGNAFANNVGFGRVAVVAPTYIEFDKVSWTPAAETGTGKTIRLYFGSVLKNESDPTLIKRRTYHVERTLGNDDDGMMSEYLVGAVPNELTLTVAQANKVEIELSFVAVDNEQRTGAQGVKAGTRATLQPGDAYNTSSDFSRIKMAIADPLDAHITPLFAFSTEMTIGVKNNVSPNKAIGVLGAFDTSAGTFEVSGKQTVYFAGVEAVQAVRNNSDVTLDCVLVKENRGLYFDLPLVALGDGRLAVQQDQPITLPLETNAAESGYGHTLLFGSFYYLPTLAG